MRKNSDSVSLSYVHSFPFAHPFQETEVIKNQISLSLRICEIVGSTPAYIAIFQGKRYFLKCLKSVFDKK
jgi:hypothetical protein